MAWIEVAAEGKRVVAAQPTEVAVATVLCLPERQHGFSLSFEKSISDFRFPIEDY
jgi:hypothetical protein